MSSLDLKMIKQLSATQQKINELFNQRLDKLESENSTLKERIVKLEEERGE